jgi:hypothetical protein
VARKENQQDITASSNPDGDSTDSDLGSPKRKPTSAQLNAVSLRENTQPRVLSVDEFKAAFTPKGGGRLSTEVQDMDVLRSNPRIRLMAERSAEAADFAVRNGYQEEAENYYPNEQKTALHFGERFNEARLKSGHTMYLPHDHSLAGHLLQGGYSANTDEERRKNLVERSAQTGLILPHLSQRKMQHAVDNQIHPMELFNNVKLYDYIGSAQHPDTWQGEWNGVKKGLGYTQDRHQNDIHMGKQFGDLNRQLSSSDSNIRRYRVHQVADHLAHEFFDPSSSISRPTFQALSWAGWRGGVD